MTAKIGAVLALLIGLLISGCTTLDQCGAKVPGKAGSEVINCAAARSVAQVSYTASHLSTPAPIRVYATAVPTAVAMVKMSVREMITDMGWFASVVRQETERIAKSSARKTLNPKDILEAKARTVYTACGLDFQDQVEGHYNSCWNSVQDWYSIYRPAAEAAGLRPLEIPGLSGK